MKKGFPYLRVLYAAAMSVIANSYVLLTGMPGLLWGMIPLYLLINLLAGIGLVKTKSLRLRICSHGAVLLAVFLASAIVSGIYHIWLGFTVWQNGRMTLLWSGLVCVGVELLLFWNGIICVYLTSVQLGIRQRLVGIICGMIPIVNVIVLCRIIGTVTEEVRFEAEKEAVDRERQPLQVCKTKYPILLVHGVFFRDVPWFNYWGRIPKALETNGARIYYGKHESAASVADSAAELTARIKWIVKESGCEKVNIIAHSKGGLDCRYALHRLDAAAYVASLTTVNTPHRGCMFADYLLEKVPVSVKNKVAAVYERSLRKLGDENPDFLAAVNDLTASACMQFDRETPAPAEIFCQSIGSVMPKASGGQFPLNFSHHLVKYFDGENDGLVSERSFAWGEKYTLLTTKRSRGISHGDVIDLNRKNLNGFDVREFYVNLVSDLKARGL